MAITDETITRLRSAAAAGDAQAALGLARLLCLTVFDPMEPAEDDPNWPEEHWLRAAVETCPDGVEALTLLTGRLAQQIAYWEAMDMAGMAAEHGQAEGAVRRRREAAELYARIRTARPHGPMEAGLDELAVLLGVSDKPAAKSAYSFHVLEDWGGNGSQSHHVTIVASDTDEIRWACDEWLVRSEDMFSGAPTLTTYVAGAEVSSIDLGQHLVNGSVNWSTAAVPELSGSPLPVGLPVPGRGLYYGFSLTVE